MRRFPSNSLRLLLFLLLACTARVPAQTVLPISSVRENDASGVPALLGQTVTVRGIVTVANQFGGPSYLQDNTGGLAVFGSTFSTAVAIGDEVVVSGVVAHFNGLTELTSPVLEAKPTTGNLVEPLVVTCAQLAGDGAGGVERYEGLLVRVNSAVVRTTAGTATPSWTVTGSGTNYKLSDASGSVDLRVDNNVDYAGTPAPQDRFDAVGVMSQFKNASPFVGGYQLMPRQRGDILTSGPTIASFPVESAITPASFRVTWTTAYPGTTRARYGKTPAYEMGLLEPDAVQRTDHAVDFSGLDPSTVYHVQAFSTSGIDTSLAGDLPVCTAAPPAATGAVNVYFNTTVNTSVAWYRPAEGLVNLAGKLAQRIGVARRSIDAAVYNLSGSVGTNVADALIAAKNRGVQVRVICEQDNRSNLPFDRLAANGIRVISDSFDPVTRGYGLMHNKFFVFDGRGGAAESVWVWTGSWNPTDPGTNADYQNAVEVQDPSLAAAYTMEFNEMWGSTSELPDAANSRFGSRKTDNTPHRFVVGGRGLEVYFSPSDRVTSRIVSAISSATRSVAFALLTFTRSDLRDALVAKKNAGLKVRGVLDNSTDQGSQYASLVAGGVDVRLRTGSGYLLHHKYSVIDAEDPAWNPLTITGSHNWSNSAEGSNDENTLFVRDGDVANQYLQEFTARYYQYGGADTIRVAVDGAATELPGGFLLEQNYPNPFNPETAITIDVPRAAHVTVRVYDLLGRPVAELLDRPAEPGRYRIRFDGRMLASGTYLVRLTSDGVSLQRKMLLLR